MPLVYHSHGKSMQRNSPLQGSELFLLKMHEALLLQFRGLTILPTRKRHNLLLKRVPTRIACLQKLIDFLETGGEKNVAPLRFGVLARKDIGGTVADSS